MPYPPGLRAHSAELAALRYWFSAQGRAGCAAMVALPAKGAEFRGYKVGMIGNSCPSHGVIGSLLPGRGGLAKSAAPHIRYGAWVMLTYV